MLYDYWTNNDRTNIICLEYGKCYEIDIIEPVRYITNNYYLLYYIIL